MTVHDKGDSAVANLELSPKERALLITLMTMGGSASNPELRERVHAALDGASRRRLNELGLVKSMMRRAYHHDLTDAGWAWCVEELSAAPPARAVSLVNAFYCFMSATRKFLDRADISLGEFVVPDAEKENQGTAADGGDVESQIRAAYWRLVREPREWVLLTAVRPLLGSASRAEVDAALRRMGRLPDVHLAPEADQKSLTADDRKAAVHVGGKDQHLLAIEAR